MVKVLLCERSFMGHRKTYMDELLKIHGIEFYVYAPLNIGVHDNHYKEYSDTVDSRNFLAYSSWVKNISELIKSWKIDVVHILDGDSIMRFFGYRFNKFGNARLIITYHHFFSGKMRKLSYRMMNSKNKTVSVVHTESVKRAFERIHVRNVARCEYPVFAFNELEKLDSHASKEKLGLPQDTPVIGIVGGMNSYKNIVPFLHTMNNCKEDFHILVAGKEGDIFQRELTEATAKYKKHVTFFIHQLTNEEYETAIVASDIIFCLYGKAFDGASGPLADAVCAKKMVLSCNHGSLGQITEQNMIGIVADCDDPKQVLQQTELAINRARDFQYCDKANQYRESLRPEDIPKKI